MIVDLAGRFSEEHPVVNTILGVGVVLTTGALLVFHRPVGRAIHRLRMWAFRARGVAAPEPRSDEDERRD
jgi:hypothetical protein